VSMRGGGWLAGSADRLRPSGGAGKAAQTEGRGGESGSAGLKAGTGSTQEEKNHFQISFKFWI
jgi:hypothetical protein